MSASSKPSLEDRRTLRDFITRIAQGIYIVTPGGHILDGNPALLDIFGADSLEQLQEYRSEDLVPDAEQLAERRRLLAERGWLRNYEYQIRRLDGEIRTVRDTVFTQRDASGQVVALHGILSDVTDDASGGGGHVAGLSSFFTGAPAGLAILDRDLCFVRINRTLARMHRLSVEDHVGRALADVLPGLEPAIQPTLQHVLDTGRPALNLEITTVTGKDPGEARTWRFSCFPVGPAEEEPTTVGLVVVDVTESKRVEEEARLDRKYLAAMIESSPIAMVMLDPDGRVLSINEAFEELFLYRPGEVIGRDIDGLLAPDEELDEARALTQRTQSGERLRVERRRMRKDGTRVEVGIFASPIVIDGHHVGAYAIYEDLNEKRLARASSREDA